MRKLFWLVLVLPFALAEFAPRAHAQARPQPAPAAPPSAEVPDRTQAAFGDWLVRCETQRPQGQPVTRVCEVALTMNDQRGQPVAQIVLGRASRTDPYRMLVQLPVELRVDQPARLLPDPAAPPAEAIALPFRLCSAARGGCFGELENVSAAMLARLRARGDNQGRLDYRDGAGRDIQILFSFRGFGQAMDALGRETGG
jgi:invasion protein IalB